MPLTDETRQILLAKKAEAMRLMALVDTLTDEVAKIVGEDERGFDSNEFLVNNDMTVDELWQRHQSGG